MSGAFLSQNQLKAIQKVALKGMVTPIKIQRRTDAAATSAATDYGDDALVWPETSESKWNTVKGWFYSTPTKVQTVDTGAIITVNTYRLYLPIGTDIKPGDRVMVGPDEYTVSDTTAESTWLVLLNVSLRKRY